MKKNQGTKRTMSSTDSIDVREGRDFTTEGTVGKTFFTP